MNSISRALVMAVIMVVVGLGALLIVCFPRHNGTNFMTAMEPDSQGRIRYHNAGYMTINILTNANGHVAYQGYVEINKGIKLDINQITFGMDCAVEREREKNSTKKTN